MVEPYVAYSVGGLGNQLFVWAFAQWMKLNHGDDVVISQDFLRQSSGKHNSFSTAIPIFRESLRHESSTAKSLRARLGIRAAELTDRNHHDWKRSGSFQVTKFIETGFPAGYEFERDRPGHQYLGYFQTYKFFEGLSLPKGQILRETVGPGAAMSDESVALHIRHGDYRKTDSPFGVLPESYYIQALERQMNIENVKQVKVFGQFDSQSNQLVESLVRNFKSIQFDTSSVAQPESAEAELIAIALHRRQILSNSSFAWWASALSENGPKIAPGAWFRSMPEPNALIPADWERQEFSW